MLNDLRFIPRWMGEPAYWGGIPVPAENFCFEGKSVFEMYYDEARPPLSDEQFECLKDYLIYYLHAPCWNVDNSILQASLKIKTYKDFEKMLQTAYDLGLDPI